MIILSKFEDETHAIILNFLNFGPDGFGDSSPHHITIIKLGEHIAFCNDVFTILCQELAAFPSCFEFSKGFLSYMVDVVLKVEFLVHV